ncbi:MAG: glycoside hydrolase family 3 N-terminal domain-containing protein, partial [Chlamydiia bacterium]
MFTRLSTLILAAMACAVCCGFTKVQDLTLEQKIGQLLMVYFHGEIANEDAKTAIQELYVGSIIYYNWANGLTSPEQVKKLSAGLQALATTPLIIAVDQEGGVVSRLIQGFTVFPGNKALGMTGNAELAERSSYAMGLE